MVAVWSNSHVHRLLHLHNPTDRTLVRRVVVFFVVDSVFAYSAPRTRPDRFPPLAEALERQAVLMAERKRGKEAMNGRPIQICEH